MRFHSFFTLIPIISLVLAGSHGVIRHKHRGGHPRPSTRNSRISPNVDHLSFAIAGRSSVESYTPSQDELRALGAKVATQTNGTTSNPLSGVIAAFVQPYGFVGYVALQLTSRFHTTPLTTNFKEAAIVTLPAKNPGSNFELKIANASAPFLGDIYGYSGSNFGSGKPGYGSMTVVQHSTYPATNKNNPTGFPSESNIWNLNTSTGELTAVWFDDDGTEVSCTIFYDATYGDMNFTGDLPAYLKIYPDNCYVTTLYFAPLSYFGY